MAEIAAVLIGIGFFMALWFAVGTFVGVVRNAQQIADNHRKIREQVEEIRRRIPE